MHASVSWVRKRYPTFLMDAFLEFFRANGNLITAATNILMAAIWVLYLSLFYLQYRKSQRLRIVISAIESPKGYLCTIANLSPAAAYLDEVQVTVGTVDAPEQYLVRDALSHRRVALRGDEVSVEQLGSERTLAQAESVTLGAFTDITHTAYRRASTDGDATLPAGRWKVTVYAKLLITTESDPVGAVRSFWLDLSDDGSTSVEACTESTESMDHSRYQQIVNRWRASRAGS